MSSLHLDKCLDVMISSTDKTNHCSDFLIPNVPSVVTTGEAFSAWNIIALRDTECECDNCSCRKKVH